MNCRTCRDNLSELVDGRLTATDRARVEEHVGSCVPCAKELEELRAIVSEVRELPRPAVPSDLLPAMKASFRRELEYGPGGEDDGLSLWRRLGTFRIAAAFAALAFTAFMLIERRGEQTLSPVTEPNELAGEEQRASGGEPGIPRVGEMRPAKRKPGAPVAGDSSRRKALDDAADKAPGTGEGSVADAKSRQERRQDHTHEEKENADEDAFAGDLSIGALDVDAIRPGYLKALESMYEKTKSSEPADAAGRNAIVARALKVTRQLDGDVHWGAFESPKPKVMRLERQGSAGGPERARGGGRGGAPGAVAKPTKPSEVAKDEASAKKVEKSRSTPAAVYLAAGSGAAEAIRAAAGEISATVARSPITTLENRRTDKVAGHELVVALPEAQLEAFLGALEARKDLSLGLLATNRPAGKKPAPKNATSANPGATGAGGGVTGRVKQDGTPRDRVGSKAGAKLVTVHFIVPGR